MKKMLVLTVLSVVLVLAALGIFELAPSSSGATNSNSAVIPAVARAYEIAASVRSGAMAAPVTGANFKVAPVFNARAEMVADPAGMMSSGHRLGAGAAARPDANLTVAPLFDTNGVVVSDPTGTVLNAHRSRSSAVPLIDANFKIAPLFDARGTVASDPSGTLRSLMQR